MSQVFDDLPPPPPQREPVRMPGSAWLCWTLVLLAASTVFTLNLATKPGRAARRESAVQPGAQELMAGRYAVGTRYVMSSLGGGPAAAQPSAQLADELVRKARTPAQRIRAAIVVGEIKGDDAALRQLGDVTPGDPEKGFDEDVQSIRRLMAGADGVVSVNERQRLIDRHGWFGELAAVHGRPDTDPARALVLKEARRTAVGALAAGIVLMLVAGAGIVLGITALVLLTTGVIRFTPQFPPARHFVLLESFTIYLVMMALTMAWGMSGLPGGRSVQVTGLAASITLALAWPIRRGMSWTDFRAGVGLHAGKGFAAEIVCGVVGYVALLPILVGGAAVTIYLTTHTGADATHPIVEALTGPLWQLVLVIILATIWAPITEELMFRGALYGHTRAIIAWPLAAIVVGVIFAGIHPQGWSAIPALASIGFNLALLRQWRGSLLASMTAHALNNGTALGIGVMLLR